MANKKKSKNKTFWKKYEKIILTILAIVVLYFAEKYGYLTEIDNAIRDTRACKYSKSI